MNAISLNSVQFNLARIVGPVGMGVVTPFVGIAGCFFVNTLTFVAMIAAVSTLDIAAIGSSGAHSIWTELRNGVRYAWSTRMIRIPLLLAAALSLFGFPYIILLPAFARDILHLGAEQYGYLVAAPGAGAVIGGLALATFGDVRRKGVLAGVTALIFSIALVGFAFSTDLPMAQLFLFLAGMNMVSAISTINTLLQLTTAPRVRGRVMSMFSFALFGLAPIGSFHLGTWAHYVGTPRALAGGGVVCFLVAAAFLAFARDLRQPVAAQADGS
jgi:MFS family permease